MCLRSKKNNTRDNSVPPVSDPLTETKDNLNMKKNMYKGNENTQKQI